MTHSKHRSTGLLAAGVVLGLLAGAPTVEAKDEFPREVARHLNARTNPPCGLCHEYGKTGNGTLVTPFAWAMRARGMGGGGSLTGALDRVAADQVDSDGDGAPDVAEIVAGTDPNSAASTPANPGAVADPKLGCAVAGGADAGAVGAIFALASLIVGVGARRRSSRPLAAAGIE